MNAVTPERVERERFKQLYEDLSSLTSDTARQAMLQHAPTQEAFLQQL
ncbi:hypothetical protein LJK87_00810 [Paenibacillus sp. P25]|nr:hypothetical protein LJK87_00810 [Paenibacillus sp. P25]